MNPYWNEKAVSLEKLDGHLKALLRLKIREFVHLSPWFKDDNFVDAPLLDFTPPSAVARQSVHFTDESNCPHRRNEGRIGRRYVRSSLHVSSGR
jgi:hypothetical protein